MSFYKIFFVVVKKEKCKIKRKEKRISNHRIERVGMEIKREVNEILQKKVRDPRVQGVTITDVQMSGDLSLAKVYYTIMSDLASDNQKVQIGLEKAKGTIKRELGKNLTMYKIPDFSLRLHNVLNLPDKIPPCTSHWRPAQEAI